MFTGSVATGKRIAAAAAKNLTPVVLELGGKDPMIVFADANLELAADAAVWGAFCNSGQSCSSVERLYVEESAAKKLTGLIVEKTRKLKQGAGGDENVSIGAMSSERQLKIVEDHVESFQKEGARVLTGGKSKDLFFEPTVISGATNSMRAMQEETFGPTLPIAVFKTEEEAVKLANDSEFGLTASVWTRDLRKGNRVAEQIEAGTVCVNEVLYTHGIGQTPWGGFKNSGRGRTHGVEGLMELVQPQHIHVNRLAILPNAWWMPYSKTAVETFRGFAKHFATGSLFQTSKLTPRLLRRIKELQKK
jgi:acyl-CoA reductase-like NAD-dependent aldehyde dehydrogenase